jgi:hypothetical protein
MMQIRQSDSACTDVPVRQDRFFERDNYWYYTTREGVQIGPFDQLAEARDGCDDFIEFITGPGQIYIPTLCRYANHAA